MTLMKQPLPRGRGAEGLTEPRPVLATLFHDRPYHRGPLLVPSLTVGAAKGCELPAVARGNTWQQLSNGVLSTFNETTLPLLPDRSVEDAALSHLPSRDRQGAVELVVS